MTPAVENRMGGNGGVRSLSVFRGWTVDTRLREFRRVNALGGIEFLWLDTEEGDVLVREYIASLSGNDLDMYVREVG